MMNRTGLWHIALAIAAASLVVACHPSRPPSTAKEEAAKAAADADAAKLAATTAANEAKTIDTEEKLAIHHTGFAGAMTDEAKAIQGPLAAKKSLTPGEIEAARKAAAMHAVETKPAQGLRP